MTLPAGLLLDTDVISETRRSRADPHVIEFLGEAESGALFLSVLTLGELRKSVAARYRTDPAAASRLGAWVDGIEAMFADRILPVTSSVARIWGEFPATRKLPVIDALIAATAIAAGLTLATRNIRDVAATGAPVVNPWQTRRPPPGN